MNEEPNDYKIMFEKVVIEKEKLLFIIEQLKHDHLVQINELQNNITSLSDHLKKYTSSKNYYEKNKDKIIEKVKEYNKNNKDKITSEKIKEYNKTAYEKRKLKLQNNN